LICTF